MIDINKNNSVLVIHRCSKGDSIENCKKRIWVLDKLYGSYIIMFVGIFLTASLSTIVSSAVEIINVPNIAGIVTVVIHGYRRPRR